MKSIYDIQIGSRLCDMHDGLSQLETKIQGFELVSHTKLSFGHTATTLDGIFNGLLPGNVASFYSTNKILYLFGEASNGTFQALYSYDNTTLGIVVFHAK